VSSAAGPEDRAAQGSRSEAQTAPAKRCGLPGRAFASPITVANADAKTELQSGKLLVQHRLDSRVQGTARANRRVDANC
jgi:hypothetical protein